MTEKNVCPESVVAQITEAFERARQHGKVAMLDMAAAPTKEEVAQKSRRNFQKESARLIRAAHIPALRRKVPMVFVIEDCDLPKGSVETLFAECELALFPPTKARTPKKAGILSTKIF